MTDLYSRVFSLDDIHIRAGGDGRTVIAYAAVFDRPAEIQDRDGHYQEQISRTAFDKTLQERAGRVGVFYNHARTLDGTPSEQGSVPIGTPLEIRPDGRGLLTTSRYNKTPLADAVLESIRNGDIAGQSFSGRFIKSDPRGPYLPARSGDLTLVTRQEIALFEYGPTPIPSYVDAEIMELRAGTNSADSAADGADHGNITTPNAADLNATARRYAASQGWAMADGSYPIRPAEMHGRDDLTTAIHAVGRGSGSHEETRRHIITRAKALELSELVPGTWTAGGIPANGSSTTATSSTSGRDATLASTPAAVAGTGATERTDAPAKATPEPRTHSTDIPKRKRTPMDVDDRMTVEERIARQSEIRARLAEIDTEHSGAVLPPEVQEEWGQLNEEYIGHSQAVQAATARAEQLRVLAANPGATERIDNTRAGYGQPAPTLIRRPDNIYDLTEARNQARSIEELPAIYTDRAMRAIELSRFPGVARREDAQTRAEQLLNTIDDDRGTLARRMLTTGSPVYDRAFGKAIAAGSIAGLSGEEQRALSLGADPGGGYAVPFQLDPTVILTSDGSINPLRQVSRQVQIVGKIWEGVTSAGVTVTRGTEAQEAPDSTPTLAQPSVGTTRVQGFVPFSLEIERAWADMRAEITTLLQDAKDTEEATSFVTGDGTGANPNGIIGTLPADSQVPQTGSAGALTVPDDIFAVEEALPPRFRARATWLGNKSVYNRIKSAAVSMAGLAGDIYNRLSAGQPPELIGYPAYELSSMPGSIATSGGGQNLVLLFGDYMRAFLIVDRIGMSMELVPHLFGAAGRPTGQRGIYAYWSNNCMILVPQALRALNVTSPA